MKFPPPLLLFFYHFSANKARNSLTFMGFGYIYRRQRMNGTAKAVR